MIIQSTYLSYWMGGVRNLNPSSYDIWWYMAFQVWKLKALPCSEWTRMIWKCLQSLAKKRSPPDFLWYERAWCRRPNTWVVPLAVPNRFPLEAWSWTLGRSTQSFDLHHNHAQGQPPWKEGQKGCQPKNFLPKTQGRPRQTVQLLPRRWLATLPSESV